MPFVIWVAFCCGINLIGGFSALADGRTDWAAFSFMAFGCGVVSLYLLREEWL